MRTVKFVFLPASFVFLLLCALSAFAARPEKLLVSFDFTNGQYPQTMSMDASGNLWTVDSFGGSGTCPEYGTSGCGTVVELTPVSGSWKPKIVYSFRGGNDGNRPSGNLVFDGLGNVYGGTVDGGSPACRCGTIFKLTSISGGWKESVIYRFNKTKTHNDGMFPWAGVIIDTAGNLYGTTESGGNGCSLSCGTVFELSPAANDTWAETVLYNFKGDTVSDGQFPAAPLVLDGHGNLYGTTYWGGAVTQGQCELGGGGCGVVFELSSNGSGDWTEAVIHGFESGNGDGFYPQGGLVVDAAGNIYGTTSAGGPDTCVGRVSCGTVFQLSLSTGGAWTETLLHGFSDGEGYSPEASLIFDTAGNLYGTTGSGGVYSAGTAFELSPNSGGGWKESVLHSFGNGHDGQAPDAPLVLDTAGNLYGSTLSGGTDVTGQCANIGTGCGTVFEIMP